MAEKTVVAPTVPDAAAAEPEVVDQQPQAAPPPSPAPAAAAAPAPPVEESPEQADKRVRDAQAKMHEATSKTAELEKQNVELRASLSRIFQDPQYRPATAPPAEAGAISDADLKGIWDKYQAVPAEKEEDAFKLLITEATNLALRRMQGESGKEAVARTNREKATQQAAQLKTAITAQVKELAPDVDLDLFWDWGAALAQREAMARTFPDVTAMIDWQVNRAIQLVRGKLGTTAARVTGPEPDVTAIRRSATPVQPSGSLTPRGGSEAPARRRTMVEQVNALRDKHVGAG